MSRGTLSELRWETVVAVPCRSTGHFFSERKMKESKFLNSAVESFISHLDEERDKEVIFCLISLIVDQDCVLWSQLNEGLKSRLHYTPFDKNT